MKIVNATPHDVHFIKGDEKLTFPKSGIIPRVEQKTHRIESLILDGVEIPRQSQALGDLTGLPPVSDDVVYIVSLLVLEAGKKQGRTDLMAPNTVRDEKGNIIGCDGFNV